LKRRIELNFSHQFAGTIWNSALSSSHAMLLLEVRDGGERKTSFSAIDLSSGKLIWTDIVFEERWWVGLDGVQGNVALFSVFTETSNPDRKSLIAYHVGDQKILWWRNDFSLSALGQNCALGISAQYGHREVVLDLLTGNETQFIPPLPEDGVVKRPVQYFEGHDYFSTVKTFLLSRFNFEAVISLEYLEESSLIFISFYQQGEQGLINDLLVLSADGETVLRENLGEQLKGIGQDTFFIYGGSVIFVKNRGELFSYKIV
jgi:Domain of unknown function (DUF4905)